MANREHKELWRIRAYDASRGLFDRFVVAARAAFVGVWLGILDRHALHAADELYYSRTRMYHDDSYNLSGLFAWETEAVERHFRSCRSVLVTSAGGGREVAALERRGLEVFGFECHSELAKAGNDLLSRHGLKARLSLGLRDAIPPGMPTCDGAVVGWASYMLIQQRACRIEFLQRLRTHIPAGGPLLISFFTRNPELPTAATHHHDRQRNSGGSRPAACRSRG